MPDHDDNSFGQLARSSAQREARWEQAMTSARENPDEILELRNFSIGATPLPEPGRQALRVIKPGGQLLIKMSHQTACELAHQQLEIAENEDAGVTIREVPQPPGS